MLYPHSLSFLVKLLGGDHRFTMLQLLSLTKWFSHLNSNHPWQYFITSCWQGKVGFTPMDELVHHSWRYLFTYSSKRRHEAMMPTNNNSGGTWHTNKIVYINWPHNTSHNIIHTHNNIYTWWTICFTFILNLRNSQKYSMKWCESHITLLWICA